MIDILNKYKERLQKELAEQCVNDTESILHDLDWWGGLDLPEGYAFDFNVYEVDDAIKAVAYLCDQRDKLGIASSSFEFSIELDVPQFLMDQYQLRKSTPVKKTISAWSLNLRWSDGETESVDLPEDFRQAHNDVNAFLDALEDERNKS